MKKILFNGILALVALAAVTFTSCGDDEENNFTFTCNIVSIVKSDQMNQTITSAYQTIVGSDATVTASGTSFTITGPESKRDAVWKKLANAEMKTMDEALTKLNVVSYVSVSTESQELNQTLWHQYYMPYGTLLPGTYTATLNGEAVKFVISETNEEPFPATVTLGDKTFTGNVTVKENMLGDQAFFFNPTDGSEIEVESNGGIYAAFEDGVNNYTGNIDYNGKLTTAIPFTRQK